MIQPVVRCTAIKIPSCLPADFRVYGDWNNESDNADLIPYCQKKEKKKLRRICPGMDKGERGWIYYIIGKNPLHACSKT